MRIAAAVLAMGIGAAPLHAADTGTAAEFFKTPDCTCREGHAEHLRRGGIEVSVKTTPDLTDMAAAAGVPPGLEGCHLIVIDGYVVSGHVPVEIVERLLEERPDIRGITLPGMPMGSPGMGGVKSGPLTIIAFGEGEPTVYAVG